MIDEITVAISLGLAVLAPPQTDCRKEKPSQQRKRQPEHDVADQTEVPVIAQVPDRTARDSVGVIDTAAPATNRPSAANSDQT